MMDEMSISRRFVECRDDNDYDGDGDVNASIYGWFYLVREAVWFRGAMLYKCGERERERERERQYVVIRYDDSRRNDHAKKIR